MVTATPELSIAFVQFIDRVRLQRGLSNAKLAESAGYSPRSLYYWKNGTIISSKAGQALIRALEARDETSKFAADMADSRVLSQSEIEWLAEIVRPETVRVPVLGSIGPDSPEPIQTEFQYRTSSEYSVGVRFHIAEIRALVRSNQSLEEARKTRIEMQLDELEEQLVSLEDEATSLTERLQLLHLAVERFKSTAEPWLVTRVTAMFSEDVFKMGAGAAIGAALIKVLGA